MAKSAKQNSAFQKMLAGKKGKTIAPVAPAKGNAQTPTNPAPKGKKSGVNIDIMLAKAMPGVGPKGMNPPMMGKKTAKKGGKSSGKGK